jgi:hypothetical protein
MDTHNVDRVETGVAAGRDDPLGVGVPAVEAVTSGE